MGSNALAVDLDGDSYMEGKELAARMLIVSLVEDDICNFFPASNASSASRLTKEVDNLIIFICCHIQDRENFDHDLGAKAFSHELVRLSRMILVIRHKGTKDYGITYKHNGGNKIYGFSDSSYGVNTQEGKGTTRIIFYYSESPISWSTQKQATLALSSCESKFITTTTAATQALWLKRLLSKLTHSEEEKVTIKVDNKSAIALMKNPVFHGRSKYIDTKIGVREEYTAGGPTNTKLVRGTRSGPMVAARFKYMHLPLMIGSFQTPEGRMVDLNDDIPSLDSSTENGSGFVKRVLVNSPSSTPSEIKESGGSIQSVVPTTKHVLDSSRDILLCLRILLALISEEGEDNENDDIESNGYGSTFEDETSLKSNGFMEFSGVGPFYGYGKNSTRGFYNEPVCSVSDYQTMSMDNKLLMEIQSIRLCPELMVGALFSNTLVGSGHGSKHVIFCMHNEVRKVDDEIDGRINDHENKYHEQVSSKTSVFDKLLKTATEAKALQEKIQLTNIRYWHTRNTW
nr:ribonuclease H-like domain, reverse transcriptase, RNA-dependent DNA polymerase [Tanacetum cinerariifolium]